MFCMKEGFLKHACQRCFKFMLSMLLVCIFHKATAQLTLISDDFNDGNISANPTWSGNTNQYAVSGSLPLEGAYHLTNTTNGSIPVIYTQYGTNTNLSAANYNFTLLYRDNGSSDPTTLGAWESFTNPNINHWRFFLAANSTDPNAASGVCLEHSGNALKLVVRSGGSGWEAGSYTISRGVTYSIKVVAKPNGNWDFYVDAGTGEATTLRASQWPNLFTSGSQNLYMIFQSAATSGNSGRFQWDKAGLFYKSLSVTQLTNGVATGDLETGMTNKALFGFAATASGGSITIRSVKIQNTNNNSSGNFTNTKFFTSVDNDYSTPGDNTELTGVSIAKNGDRFDITNIDIAISSGSTRNFFLVSDISAGSASSMQFSMTCSSCGASGTTVYTDNAELVNNFSFSGNTYNFLRVCIWNNTTTVGNYTDDWQSSNAWENYIGPPTANDIVMFSKGGSVTPLNIPTMNLKRLVIKGNTTVNITTSSVSNGSRTLTLTGNAGDDLEIESGATLNVSSTGNTFSIAMSSGTSANIAGTIQFAGKNHTLTAASAGAIVFTSGGMFKGMSGLTGSPFGSTVTGSVVFASGATLEDQVGLNYFTSNNVVAMNNGSNYRQATTVTPAINGKTFANLVLSTGSTWNLGSNNITVNGSITGSGTLSMTSGNINVTGDFLPTGTFTPGTGTITLNGTNQSLRNGTYANLAIAGSGTKTLAGDVTVSNTLNITGGKLAIGANTLTLNGTVTGLSASNALQGTANASITIGGTGALGTLFFDQSTDGTTNIIRNLVVNRANLSGTITLGNTLRIKDTLRPVAGTINTNGNLVFTSTANSTARILAINPSNFAINGNVMVERYITPKTSRRWIFLSSAVAGVTIRNGWQDDIFITGPGTGGTICGTGGSEYNSNGFDASSANTYSLYTFDQANTAKWVAIANTTSTNIEKGKGYRVLVRGSRNTANACADQLQSTNPATPAATTLNATGTLTTGNVNVTVAGKTTGTTGYTLLGNPYQCEVDFAAFYTANSSIITNKYWTYDPGSSNTNYLTYNNGVVAGNVPSATVTNANGNRIAPGQAFFVESVNGGTATFTESMKTSNVQNGVFRTTAVNKIIRTTFKRASNEFIDNMVIRFSDDPAITVDENFEWDAASMNSSNFIAGIKGSRSFAIQTRPISFYNDTVLVRIVSASTGDFKLEFSEFEDLDEAAEIQLLDLYTGTITNVKTTTVYPFTITSDDASKGGRFQLIFRSAASVLPVSFLHIAAVKKDEGVQVQWQLGTEQGVQQYEIQRSINGRDFVTIGSVASKGNSIATVQYSWLDKNAPAADAFYRIKSVELNGALAYSAIVKVSGNNAIAMLSVFPNPAKDQLNVSLPAGNEWQITVRSANGATVLQQNKRTNQFNSLDIHTLAPGLYHISAVNTKGEVLRGRFVKM